MPSSTIDIFEKLPVPFGLVRYGVAPDHADVKNVVNNFSKLASNPRVRFVGNVSLGEHFKLSDLKKAYHAVFLVGIDFFSYSILSTSFANVRMEIQLE